MHVMFVHPNFPAQFGHLALRGDAAQPYVRAYSTALERTRQNEDALAQLNESIGILKRLERSEFPGSLLDRASASGQRAQLLAALVFVPQRADRQELIVQPRRTTSEQREPSECEHGRLAHVGADRGDTR